MVSTRNKYDIQGSRRELTRRVITEIPIGTSRESHAYHTPVSGVTIEPDYLAPYRRLFATTLPVSIEYTKRRNIHVFQQCLILVLLRVSWDRSNSKFYNH